MIRSRIAVAAFPGENGADDVLRALFVAGGEGELVSPTRPLSSQYRAVILPGGFAHGDALRPGALARLSPLVASLRGFVEDGGLVLGICNGFQVLLETGLLPGALRPNRSGRFLSRRLSVTLEDTSSPFLAQYEKKSVLKLIVAHGQGRYWTTPENLDELQKNGAVALRYGPNETGDDPNPNGSVGAVAGVTAFGGRVLGLMPHPERVSESVLGPPDGASVFSGLLGWLNK